MKKALHIIAFDIPFPANYGGVIDVFYKLKSLWAQGVEITLHCFEYGSRSRQVELEKYCKVVYYYPRRKWVYSITLPYIVSSRNDKQLLNHLLKDNSPILFEAIHSCFFLDHPLLKNRQKLVRMHNIEHDYYALLAHSEHHWFKKQYYRYEAWLLEQYEKVLRHADQILAISEKDRLTLAQNYGDKVKLLPAFHENTEFVNKVGKGNYCFYHGKLSVAENHLAAMFLVEEVFPKIRHTLKIAGDGYSQKLKKAIQKQAHVELLEGLNTEEINALIRDAHINVLPTFQPTGIKLKLINVLFQGRFLLVNPPMVNGSGLEDACFIAQDASGMAKAIDELMPKEFSFQEIEKRKKIVGLQFDNTENASQLIALLNPVL